MARNRHNCVFCEHEDGTQCQYFNKQITAFQHFKMPDNCVYADQEFCTGFKLDEGMRRRWHENFGYDVNPYDKDIKVTNIDFLEANYWHRMNVHPALLPLHPEQVQHCNNCSTTKPMEELIKDDKRVWYCYDCKTPSSNKVDDSDSANDALIITRSNIKDVWRKQENLHRAFLLLEEKQLLDKIDFDKLADDALDIVTTVSYWLADDLNVDTSNIDNPVALVAQINSKIVAERRDKGEAPELKKLAGIAETLFFIFRLMPTIGENPTHCQIYHTSLGSFAVSYFASLGDDKSCARMLSRLDRDLEHFLAQEKDEFHIREGIISSLYDVSRPDNCPDSQQLVLPRIEALIESLQNTGSTWLGRLGLGITNILYQQNQYEQAKRAGEQALAYSDKKQALRIEKILSEIQYQKTGEGSAYDFLEKTELGEVFTAFKSLLTQIESGQVLPAEQLKALVTRFFDTVKANPMQLSTEGLNRALGGDAQILLLAKAAMDAQNGIPPELLENVKAVSRCDNLNTALEADILLLANKPKEDFPAAVQEIFLRLLSLDSYGATLTSLNTLLNMVLAQGTLFLMLNLNSHSAAIAKVLERLYQLQTQRQDLYALLLGNRMYTQNVLEIMEHLLLLIAISQEQKQPQFRLLQRFYQLQYSQYNSIISNAKKPNLHIDSTLAQKVTDQDVQEVLSITKKILESLDITPDNGTLEIPSDKHSVYLMQHVTGYHSNQDDMRLSKLIAIDEQVELEGNLTWAQSQYPISEFYDATFFQVNESATELFSAEIFPGAWQPNQDSFYIKTFGALAGIPYAALKLKNGDYLASQTVPTLHVQGGDLAALRFNPNKILALGNPAYVTSTVLAHSQQEIDSIKQCFDQEATLMCGHDANVKRVLSEINHTQFDVLHFACHGLDHEVSAMAHLQLSEESLDGSPCVSALSYAQVLSLDLRHVKLVVLSACSSFKGKTSQMEGVFSMTQAFKAAGVQSVIASRWTADDESTVLYWDSFYHALKMHRDVIKAQLAATRRLINHEQYAEPYYWAGFQLLV